MSSPARANTRATQRAAEELMPTPWGKIARGDYVNPGPKGNAAAHQCRNAPRTKSAGDCRTTLLIPIDELARIQFCERSTHRSQERRTCIQDCRSRATCRRCVCRWQRQGPVRRCNRDDRQSVQSGPAPCATRSGDQLSPKHDRPISSCCERISSSAVIAAVERP